MNTKKIIIGLIALVLAGLGFQNKEELAGFATMRGFSTLPTTGIGAKVSYDFGVVDMPTERAGAASSSMIRLSWPRVMAR